VIARTTQSFAFGVGDRGQTTATVYRAHDPLEIVLVLAHGAGAPQSHPFLTDVAGRLARRGLDVVTFDFLYAARGRKLPDRNDALEACWRAAIASVRARKGLKASTFLLGGKSMGGRIASQVVAGLAREGGALSDIDGLVLLGYPLHPPKKPATRRDAHLPGVPCPMLFVQGARDPFGNAAEMRALVRGLPRAELHLVAEGDHSLSLPRRSGADAQERELEAAVAHVAAFAVQRAAARPRARGRPGP
jgi:predicted alpha/beta-hydrolase family hydrolase